MSQRNERYFVGKWEYFPLHRACVEGNFIRVEELLATNEFDTNEEDENDLSPVECAIIGKRGDDTLKKDEVRINIIRLLLDNGARDHTDFLNNCTFSNPSTHPLISELNICKSFIARAIKVQFELAVKFFLNIIKSNIKPGNDFEHSKSISDTSPEPTGTSRVRKAFDFVRKYVWKKEQISKSNTIDITVPEHVCYYTEALKFASLYSDIEIVKIILNEGSDHIDRSARTQAISNALFARNFEVTLLLLQNNEDILMKISNENFLRDAAQSGQFEIFKLLLKSGNGKRVRNFQSFDDNKEWKCIPDSLPLMMAAKSGNYDIVKLFVESGSDPFVVESGGRTSVHYAAAGGSLKTVKYLIDQGVSWKRCDYNNVSPLQLAALGGHYEVVIYLLQLGFDPHKKDNGGRTSLHYAVDRVLKPVGRSETDSIESVDGTKARAVAEVRKHEIFQLLLNSGCDPLELDNDGKSILHYTSSSGNSKILRFILNSFNFDINLKDKKLEETPLHLATKHGHADLCQLLIDNGADVNAVDSQGRSMLHKAVESDDLSMVRLITDYTDDIDVKDYKDRTALRITTDYNNCFIWKYDEKIAEYLLSKGADPRNHSLYKFHDSISSPNIFFLDVTAMCRILTALFDHGESVESLHEFYKRLKEHEQTSSLLMGFNDDFLFYVVFKFKAAGIAFNEIDNAFDPSEFDDFRYALCQNEIKSMKAKKLSADSNICYYDFLKSSSRSAACIIMDESLEESLDSQDYDEFPIYSDMIKSKINRARHLKKLIQNGILFFNSFVRIEPKLNIDSIRTILSYLTIKDLTALLKVDNKTC